MSKKQRTKSEWVGGLVSMPAFVTGEGEPYRPEALFWMGAEGAVLGWTVGKPGEALGAASASLREAMEHPMWGPPHVPRRVRVSSPELAAALRAGHPGLDVVCAPTPETDVVLASMLERMSEHESEQSYLSEQIRPEVMASLFRAAAALFRAQPWKVVPTDQSLLSVTIEELGVRDGVLSIIGQAGQSFGLILFSGVEGFEAYLDAAEAMEDGEEPDMPPHLALSFERGAEMSAALRDEIAEHDWEVAAEDAYPWFVAVDENMTPLSPSAEQLTIVEAISLALAEMLAAKDALAAAWNGGEAVVRALSVRTHAGELQVVLRAPPEPEPFRPPSEVLADLADLVLDDDEEVDIDVRHLLEDELVRSFVASPEGKALDEIDSCHLLMDLAADHFGVTLATLGPEELRILVFELVPLEVGIEPSAARPIIEQNGALYAFLEREAGLGQAGACLRVLGGDAVARLEAALAGRGKPPKGAQKARKRNR